jgi:hypothetical protein
MCLIGIADLDMGFSKACKVLLPAKKFALDLSSSSGLRIVLSRFLLQGLWLIGRLFFIFMLRGVSGSC